MSLTVHSGRAFALSKGLGVPALFVLMQVGSVPKGHRSRVFHVRWLQTPATLKPLRNGGTTLDQALSELIGNGMIRRVGRVHLICTAEGDLVKHCFNDLLAEAEVHGALARLAPDKLARTAALRVAMGSLVDGKGWATIKREIGDLM